MKLFNILLSFLIKKNNKYSQENKLNPLTKKRIKIASITNDIVRKANSFNVIMSFQKELQLKLLSEFIIETQKHLSDDSSNNISLQDNIYIRVPIKSTLDKFDIAIKNIKRVTKIAEEMIQPIQLPINQKNKWHVSVLFTDIYPSEDGLYWNISVNKTFIPYIQNLTKNYTTYYQKNIVHLKSKYSIRIYELLKQHQNHITLKGFFIITILEFKIMLNLSVNKYRQYGELKRFILISSQKELEEKTDISFSLVEYKSKIACRGRPKVQSLKFLIKPNTQNIIQKKIK